LYCKCNTRLKMRESQIVVRVESALKKAFEKQCEALGVKPSEAIRDLILAFTRLEMRHRFLTGEEPLTRELTVARYLAMSEEERETIWRKWYEEAEKEAVNVELKVKKVADTPR